MHTNTCKHIDTLDNHWFVGEPGTGKSRTAREEYGDSLFNKGFNKWWDGYQNEENVLLDDLSKTHAYIDTHLKHWADHYTF